MEVRPAEVMDVDAGSFRDWLCMVDNAGWPRSCSHCPLALFLDEAEGGTHIVGRNKRGRYFVTLTDASPPTARLDPGERKPLPGWAQWFLTEFDTIEDECLEPEAVTGFVAAEVLDWAVTEEERHRTADTCDGF